MKFRRAYRGKGKHVYTIRAGRSFIDQGLLQMDRGLHAEFALGFFDSEVAAKTLGWSDDERDLVERYLQSHGDFGHGLYLDASEPGAAVRTAVDVAPTIEGQEPPALHTVCIASVEQDGESQMCGKPTVDAAGEFCAEHYNAFAVAEGA